MKSHDNSRMWHFWEQFLSVVYFFDRLLGLSLDVASVWGLERGVVRSVASSMFIGTSWNVVAIRWSCKVRALTDS